VVGLLLLIYGFLGDRLPEPLATFLSPGFAVSIGIALIVVAICLYFSQEAGWITRENSRKGSRGRR